MTRHKILTGSVIGALTMVLIGWSVAPALASGPMIGMAVTAKGNVCGVPDGDGDGVIVADPDNIKVIANSANNNLMLSCHASGVPNSQGHAVKLTGFGCGIGTPFGLIVTFDTRATISADGEVSMTCKFKA